MADVTISQLSEASITKDSNIVFSNNSGTFRTTVKNLSSAGVFLPTFNNLNRPATGEIGQLIYNTSTGTVQVWVGIWSNITTPAGIYSSIEAAQSDGVIMYFPLNSIANTTSTIGGAGCNLTIQGNIITNASGIVGGSSGSILRGDSDVTAYIRVNGVPTGGITSNNWSLSFWFYKTSSSIYSSSDGAAIIWPYYGTDTVNFGGFSTIAGSNPAWGYAGSNAESLYGYSWPNATNSSYIVATNFFLNTWYHLVVTHTTNSLKHYVNGNLLMTKTDNPTINNNWSLGNYYYVQNGNSNNHYGKGRFDELVLFNRVLSDSEISSLYNNQLIGRQLITGVAI